MTKTTYEKKKHCIGRLLGVLLGVSTTIMVGTMGAGRHGAGSVAEHLYPYSQLEAETDKKPTL